MRTQRVFLIAELFSMGKMLNALNALRSYYGFICLSVHGMLY